MHTLLWVVNSLSVKGAWVRALTMVTASAYGKALSVGKMDEEASALSVKYG